jgi:hypothetical protein
VSWSYQLAAIWLYQHVVEPSWLSLATAPPVFAGYWLLGRKRREGWLCVIASQFGLLAIGLVDGQYGLLVVLLLMWQAARNYRRAGRPAGRSRLLREEAR